MKNGYCTITIEGKAVGIRFGMLAVKVFSLAAEKKRNVYYDKVGDVETLTFMGMAKLLHCAYLNQCEVDEVESELKYADFVDYVDGAASNDLSKELAKALNTFADSQFVKSLAERNTLAPEEAKKKTVRSGGKKQKRHS